MSRISPAVQSVLLARQDANRQQIDMALLGKSLETQQELGNTLNELLQQSVDIQKQLASGHIDIRV